MATYYVSKSTANGYVVGNDSNNGTAISTPWLTLSKVSSTAADGDTVYVNDGVYSDLELGAASVFSLNSTKSLKMYPVTDYGVILQSTAASAQIVSLTGTATNEMIFGKFVIDCEIPGAPGTYQPTAIAIPNTAANCTLTLAGTKILNAGTQNILNSRRRGTMTFDLVFGGLMAQGIASTASGADVATCTVTVSSLVLDHVQTSTNALSRVLDFTRLSTSASAYTLTVRSVTGEITAPAALGSSAAIALLVATGIDDVVAENFNATYTAVNTGATCYGIYIKNASAGATATAHRPIIRNNTITGNAPAEYIISAGDTTTAYDVNDALIYGNTITAPYFASSTPHCIALGNTTRGRVYGNRTNGGYVGVLAGINQGGLISGNVSVGCYGYPFYAKGCGATTAPVFLGNTAILTSTYGAARGAGLGVAAQGATNNTAVTFQNNLVYAYTDLYRFAEVGLTQEGTFTTNNYYSAGPAGFTSPWAYQADTYTTFGDWLAARETTGLNVAPLLVDVANGDYRLQPTSQLKRAGTRGSASFRSYTQGPALNPPDIGAYQSTSGAVAATRTARS